MVPIIETNNLSKTYILKSPYGKIERFTALFPTNIEIFPSQTLGIVGESGSGKSTLAKTLLRLTEPTSGEIIYTDLTKENNIDQKNNTIDLVKLNKSKMRSLRRDLQMVFQNPYATLNPQQTIKQTLLEPFYIHKMYSEESQTEKKLNELLDAVSIPKSSLNKYPHEFSGGQRQRISIARAIATKPKLIVCDECVSALDVSVQAQILNLLKDIQQHFKIAYLFISHDLNVVKAISHQVAVMFQGKIIEKGDTDTIYNDPKHDYTKKLICS